MSNLVSEFVCTCFGKKEKKTDQSMELLRNLYDTGQNLPLQKRYDQQDQSRESSKL